MMVNYSSQLGRCFCRRSKTTDSLERIVHLDSFFQLIVALIGKAERIAFVRRKKSFPSLLNMNHVDRNIKILQILHQSPMVVASHFEQNLDLDQWDIGLDTVNERAETLMRVFNGKHRTMVKTLMASK